MGLSWLGFVFAFLFGISAGSFLNVCIHRLPRDMSIIRPPSRCPYCLKRILWYDNIPLLSYLILRGRCRNCKAPISPRYFLIEAATGVAFVLFYRHYILSCPRPDLAQGIIYLLLTCSLILASFIDIEHRIAPDEITVRGMVLAPLVSLLYPRLHLGPGPEATAALTGIERLDGLIACAVGMIVGAGLFYGLGLFGKALFRRQAMGFGDVKLMAFLGGFLGWKVVLLVFFLGAFFGVIWGVATRSRIIPYVPSLSLALLMVMLWDKPLWLLNHFIADLKTLFYLWRYQLVFFVPLVYSMSFGFSEKGVMKISTKEKIREAGKWVKVIIIVAFLVLLVVFIGQNWKETEVGLIFGTRKMPLGLLVLAIFIVGVGIGFVTGKVKGWKKK